jgi:hypothetical protein
MCTIHIGGESAEYLTLEVLGRSYPGSTDFWDGNWLHTHVEVAVGGFRGSVEGDIRVPEFISFYEQLEVLYRSLEGAAEFSTLESWLSLHVVGDGRGHVVVNGEVQDTPGVGNRLQWRIETDQTSLRTMLRGLRRAIVGFPVLGSSEDATG